MADVGFVGRRDSARKFEVSAAGLGIDLITYSPDGSGRPEGRSSGTHTLDDCVARSKVITVEFGCEHDTYCAAMDVADRKLRPNSSAIHLAHEPLAARYVFRDCGFDVAEFAEVDSGDDEGVQRFARQHGWPVRLRPSHWGLGVPAVHGVRPHSVLDQVWAGSSAQRWLLETWEPLAPQLAVVTARRPSGGQAVLGVIANPAHDCQSRGEMPVSASIRERAVSTTKSIADGLNATGIVTVQFVCSSDGRLLVDGFTYGPAACAAASCVTDDTMITAHLQAILDLDPDRSMHPRAQPLHAAAATQQATTFHAASTTNVEAGRPTAPTIAKVAQIDGLEQALDRQVVPVGIVGGGQLARMMVLAAARLGIEVCVLARSADDAVCSILPDVMFGDPDDPRVLEEFTRRCQIVTFDHENVDPALVDALTRIGRIIRPGAATLRACDKASQRVQFAALGFPVPPFAVISNSNEMTVFARANGGWPVVAKARRGGYDGRGVRFVDGEEQAIVACALAGSDGMLIEPALDIERELAVLVARRPGGDHVVYPVVDVHTSNFVCESLVVPAQLEPGIAAAARTIAVELAHVLDAVGILAVEFFVVDGQVLVNEIAPRPHNTGHFTIEGCVTSQFENHLRAVLDLPLGSTALVAPGVATTNVFGGGDGVDPRTRASRALTFDRAHLHLYAKQARTGRKLGHITVLDDDPQAALATARRARDALAQEPT